MAPKRNLKKQLSTCQLRTTTTPPRTSLLALINKSNNSSQTKSLCFASLDVSFDTFLFIEDPKTLIIKDPKVEAYLINNKLV